MPRDVAPKPGERGLLQIADWTGGLNTRVSKFLVKDNQAVEISNFFFGLGGVLKVRPGSDRKTTTSFGAGGIKGGVRYYPVGSAQLVVDHGTMVRQSTDGGVTFSTLTLPVVLSAFTRAHYVQTQDLLFRADGVNTPLKYNGTTVTRWGLVAPASAGSGAETTGGSLTTLAIYQWKITFVSATSESNGNTTAGSITLTGANNKVNLSSIPVSSDAQVTSRRVYRTKANGAIFYFERTIGDNVTTTSELSSADSALGVEMPTDKDAPPADLEFVELFKNRLFGIRASNRRQVLFTELFEPEAWPLDFGINIPFPEGDSATGLRARGDLLFVFGTSTIFVIVGDTPFNFTIRQTFADEGYVSSWGVIEVENVTMGPTRFGFQAFDGANAKILSVEIEPTLRNEIDLANLSTAAGAYDIENRVGRWSVPFKDGTRGEIVFDLFRRAWTRTTRSIANYMPFRGSPDQGELYTGDPSNGYVWQENVGTNDEGANILAKYRTKTFEVGTPRYKKRFWHSWFDFKPSGGTLSVTATGGSGLHIETFSPSLLQAGSATLYGTGEYGVSTYGGVLIDSWDEGYTYDPTVSKDFVIRYAEFYLEYNGQDPFELYRLDTEYDVESWLRKT